jgi:hypothetical protein
LHGRVVGVEPLGSDCFAELAEVDVVKLTEQMKASGPVADWQQVLTAMRDNDIAGIEMAGDDIQFTPKEA